MPQQPLQRRQGLPWVYVLCSGRVALGIAPWSWVRGTSEVATGAGAEAVPGRTVRRRTHGRRGSRVLRAQRVTRIDPTRTRSPDDSALAPARWRVTVKLGYSGGASPAHSVTFSASSNVPTGTRTPASL